MATVKKCATLVKRLALADLVSPKEGLGITPLLNGPHGVGKSMILKTVAKELGGYCFLVDCSALKEGEITGLPFAAPNPDGTTEVRFVKYNMINRIYQLEKFMFEKACNTGFLNGEVKITINENGEKVIHEFGKTTVVSDIEKDIINGEDNRYKFGEYLSPETRLKLVESGEVKMIMLFMDELNRTEMQTQKELMNILLNRSINGYDLPWNVFITAAVNPCSQNSVYATNEMDPAQLDRFLKIKISPDINEWVDYALRENINTDVVEALAVCDQIFTHYESSEVDTSELTPTPRSWEIVAHIYNTIHELNQTKWFSPEERKDVDSDLRTLITGKVGPDAARTILQAIDRKADNIKPEQILTMTSKAIPEAVVSKFNGLKRLSQKIVADSLISYVHNNIESIEKLASGDEKSKEKYSNFSNQFKQFILLLDNATQLTVLRTSIDKFGRAFFMKIAKHMSKDVILAINEARIILNDLTKE